MRQFFTVTGLVLIVFAAGLVSRTVLWLQAAGDLGTAWNNVYDLTADRWLTVTTESGRFLGAMFGWDPRPSIEQVVAYLAFLVTVAWLFLRARGRPANGRRRCAELCAGSLTRPPAGAILPGVLQMYGLRGRSVMQRRLRILSLPTLLALALVAAMGGSPAYGSGKDSLSRVNHIVVIYQENHSFDNLYGRWEGVNGLRHAPRSHTVQVNQAGEPYDCLLQNDVNLTSPPLSVRCTDTTTGTAFSSHFRNRPFTIDHYIPPTATTCPPPGVSAPNGVLNGQGLPGGCTRDLVHRFYQEQYQLNDGRQNRYVTGSDAVGLAMGVYDTRALPIYRYLHGSGHPRYAIADSFFQAAFGGSFLNHQWLIAARNPVWPGAVNDGGADDLHSVVDENGMPVNYPLYVSPLGTAGLPGRDPLGPR